MVVGLHGEAGQHVQGLVEVELDPGEGAVTTRHPLMAENHVRVVRGTLIAVTPTHVVKHQVS